MLHTSPWARDALEARQAWPEAVRVAMGHRISLSADNRRGPFIAKALDKQARVVDAEPLAAVRRLIEALA